MGSSLGWSDLYTFRAIKNGTDWPVRLALFGDMGNENAQSLARLQEETQQGHFDAVFHVGTCTADSRNNSKILASLQDYSVGKSSCPQIYMVAGLYAGSNFCQSHVLVCQSHVLVETLMLTVKLVYKLSNCA